MDTSLFCLLVQINGADGFKLVLINVSEKLNGLDTCVVHPEHDEIIVEVREDIAN
jgi:DNA polymerase I-like protein with 3'-5' exonuclease and polymerase domains